MYHVDSYEKYTRLAVTFRYLVQKEHIPLPITDQETMEITFSLVEVPGNSVELYISASEEPLPHIGSYSHSSTSMHREASLL